MQTQMDYELLASLSLLYAFCFWQKTALIILLCRCLSRGKKRYFYRLLVAITAPKPSIESRLIGGVEDAHKGLLGDLHGADVFHPLLAFPLSLEHFHFSGDVAAVEFRGNVFSERLD